MKKHFGFTLIELLIAMIIIGILVAIALPSYQAHLIKGRRASAQSHLMDIAQRQQQYLLDARAYAPDLATLNITTPANVSTYYSPITITLPVGTLPSFIITATPTGAQAADGALSITNTGVKTPAGKW